MLKVWFKLVKFYLLVDTFTFWVKSFIVLGSSDAINRVVTVPW